MFLALDLMMDKQMFMLQEEMTLILICGLMEI